MLYNMILNGKYIYINELMQQLELEKLIEARCRVRTIKHNDHDHVKEQVTHNLSCKGGNTMGQSTCYNIW
jgi:hypothetical protein